jgi:hypothetical protein
MTSLDTAFDRAGLRPLAGESSRVEAATPILSAETGRRLAELELDEIIAKIKRWASTGRLSRGLRLSLPFYNDQDAEMSWLDIDVIPNGRVMFVPAFVVLAVHRQAEKIRASDRFTDSTRAHLLGLLRELQQAFGPVPEGFRV